MTLRRLNVLVRGLPSDSATSRAVSGTGLSRTEQLLMELWWPIGGQLHPRHPDVLAKAQEPTRTDRLKARQAHWDQVREQQRVAREEG